VKSAAEAQTHGNLVAVDGSEGLRGRAEASVEGKVVLIRDMKVGVICEHCHSVVQLAFGTDPQLSCKRCVVTLAH
jgi:hypothetical protein